jgi:hypothetical protein
MSDQMPGLSDSPPPNRPMSIALARALAEAADGFVPRADPTFIVAPYVPLDVPTRGGFAMSGPYGSWDEVPDELKAAVVRGESGFFGPFDTSMAVLVAGRSVGRVDLHVEPDVYSIPARRIDALFFTASAVEKFAQPYYERIFGPEFTEQVMRHFQEAEVQVMGHFPWTEYADGVGVQVPNVPSFLRRTESGIPAFVPLHQESPSGHVPRGDAVAGE